MAQQIFSYPVHGEGARASRAAEVRSEELSQCRQNPQQELLRYNPEISRWPGEGMFPN